MADQDRPPEGEEEKPKFKIIDRRRIDVDEVEPAEAPTEPHPTPEPETPPEQPSEEPETTAPPEPEKPSEEPEPTAEEAKADDPLIYRNLVLSFLQTLNTIAWVHLGLVPHPQTQLVAKKMEEARKVINLIEVLQTQVKDDLSPELNTEIDRLVQDLKANYVNQL